MTLAASIAILAGCTRSDAQAEFNTRGFVASLDRILAWHQKNAPALAATLQPGLSRSEMERLAHQHKTVLFEI